MNVNVVERLSRARESVAEGNLLMREGMGGKLVLAKFYHAMMQSLFALFGIRDIGRRTHAEIIDRFEQDHISGQLGPSVHAALRRTYDLTHECDCDHMPVPTSEDIAAAERAANALIGRAAMLLGRRERYMKVALFDVDKNLCVDCSMALRRFIGGMDGVESIDVEQGKIAVKFDEAAIDEEKLSKIARDSIERLGYRVKG